MSKSVFISHAAKDSEIAEKIVDLLEGGIGVPENEIFCSSLEGYGIPTGENFVTYIKGQIQKPKVVILLLTPAYFASNFCLSELGASWAMSHDVFPILVPPLSYGDVKDVLLGTQVAEIDNDIKYNELRDFLYTKVSCASTSSTKWDIKRKAFLRSIIPLLGNISLPETVSSEELNQLRQELDECKQELLSYEEEFKSLKDYIKHLEKLKDAESIKKTKEQLGRHSVPDEFEKLVDDVASFSSKLGSEVFKFVLCEHYGKPYKVNHFEHDDEFSVAARYNYIDIEDGESVNWDNREMKKLQELLNKVRFMLEDGEHIDELVEYHEDRYGLEPEIDNQAFWELHYKI